MEGRTGVKRAGTRDGAVRDDPLRSATDWSVGGPPAVKGFTAVPEVAQPLRRGAAHSVPASRQPTFPRPAVPPYCHASVDVVRPIRYGRSTIFVQA